MPRSSHRLSGDITHHAAAAASRPRWLVDKADLAVNARLETSSAAGGRLLHALQEGATEFVLTSRDGRLAAGVRLSLADPPLVEHHLGGKMVAVDWSEGTAACGQARTSLSRTELRLLAALLESGGEPMRRAQLIARVWPYDRGDEYDRENALAVYVCALRRRLRGIGIGGALHTVRGVGYRLK